MAPVDEQIHPTASGQALKTVEAHSQPAANKDDLVFYAGWFCPFVQRVWISLEEKGIPYQYKEENPYKKDADFLKVSPKGLVPALKWRGKALHESLVMFTSLKRASPIACFGMISRMNVKLYSPAYPDAPPLLPQDAFERALIGLAIDHVSKAVVPAFYRLIQNQEKDAQDSAMKDLYQALKKFSEGIKGPFVAGDQVTLADVALVPWVARFPIIEKHRGFDPTQVGETFNKWIASMQARPSYQATLSEADNYEEVYGRYLRNETQSEVGKATRAGKDLP